VRWWCSRLWWCVHAVVVVELVVSAAAVAVACVRRALQQQQGCWCGVTKAVVWVTCCVVDQQLLGRMMSRSNKHGLVWNI